MLVLANTIPVNPPTVNKKIKPFAQSRVRSKCSLLFDPWIVESHLKIFTPVGIAISRVTAEKYPRVSTSIPIVNM